MKFIAVALLVSVVCPAFAQSIGSQDIEPMLRQMQEAGKISAKEAEITRKYMATMGPEEWKKVEEKAQDAIDRNPAAAERVSEQGIDALSGEDFGISKP